MSKYLCLEIPKQDSYWSDKEIEVVLRTIKNLGENATSL